MEMLHHAQNAYSFLDRVIRKEINYHKVRPTNMLFYLTYRCTSQCRSCTMWQRKTPKEEMTFAEWQRVIDMVKECGYDINYIEMFGGDALLRKDVLCPLSSYSKSKGIGTIDLTTNANLLDRETCEGIVEAGIDTVYVSLDGIGELHDRVRGVKGSFDRTRNGIVTLLKARKDNKKPKIVVNCTISALNVNGFEKVLPFADEIGADNVALEYVGEFSESNVAQSRIGGAASEPYYMTQGSSLLLKKEQAVYLKSMVQKMKKTSANMRVYMNTGNIDILSVENMTRGEVEHRRCYVCRYLMLIDPYGNLIPCPFFGNYHLGNVRKEHLGKIWNNERHREFIRNADKGKFALCKRCILGAERNRTLWQAAKKIFYEYRRKGVDEP